MTNLRSEPRTSDGRLITQPVTLDDGYWHVFAGAGDTQGLPGSIGGGTACQASHAAADFKHTEWNFRDTIGVAGGTGKYAGAVLGDYVSISTFAPATQATSTPGTGNANKYNLGGPLNMFTAAPDSDGDWTIVLDDGTAHPVPNAAQTGQWNYAKASKGWGTTTLGSGASGYDLYDFEVTLVPFVVKEHILGAGVLDVSPPNVHPTDVFPEWSFRCSIFNVDAAHTVEMVWRLVTARTQTS